MASPTLNAALSYIRQGYSVIPVNGKVSALKEWRTYQERLPTVQEVVQWWSKWPTAGVAIVTGKTSGVVVADGDGEAGIKTLEQLGIESPVKVGTGHGIHYYFSHPGEKVLNAVKRYDGVDIRGDGGYVVAPPSMHPDGRRYVWSGVSLSREVPPFPIRLFTPANTASVSQEDQPLWVSDLLREGIKKGEKRHPQVVKLVSYFCGKGLPLDVIVQMMLDFNTCKVEEAKSDKYVIDTVNDIYTRFKQGIYTSNAPSTLKGAQQHNEYKRSESDPTPHTTYIPRVHLGEYKQRVLARLQQTEPELPTGYRFFDDRTHGLRRQSLYTFAARSGVGKSSFLVGIARNLCESGKRVLFFSTESSFDEIWDRYVSVCTSIPTFKLATGNLGQSDFDSLETFYRQFTDMEFYVPEISEPDIHHIRDEVEKHQPDVVIFDHIQRSAKTSENTYKEMSRFIRDLKSLARDENVAVLIASQLNRLAEVEKPAIHHLKECGTIEEESSVVVLLDPIKGSDPEAPTASVNFEIVKNRHGGKGETQLLFERLVMRFKETC